MRNHQVDVKKSVLYKYRHQIPIAVASCVERLIPMSLCREHVSKNLKDEVHPEDMPILLDRVENLLGVLNKMNVSMYKIKEDDYEVWTWHKSAR